MSLFEKIRSWFVTPTPDHKEIQEEDWMASELKDFSKALKENKVSSSIKKPGVVRSGSTNSSGSGYMSTQYVYDDGGSSSSSSCSSGDSCSCD